MYVLISRGYVQYTESTRVSVPSFVGIGSPHPFPRKWVCLPLLDPKGWVATPPCGWEGRGTGWHSEYSVIVAICAFFKKGTFCAFSTFADYCLNFKSCQERNVLHMAEFLVDHCDYFLHFVKLTIFFRLLLACSWRCHKKEFLAASECWWGGLFRIVIYSFFKNAMIEKLIWIAGDFDPLNGHQQLWKFPIR